MSGARTGRCFHAFPEHRSEQETLTSFCPDWLIPNGVGKIIARIPLATIAGLAFLARPQSPIRRGRLPARARAGDPRRYSSSAIIREKRAATFGFASATSVSSPISFSKS